MDRTSAERVFQNPYLIDEILKRLDVRSLFQCCSVSKEFFDGALLEHQRRKDIIHHVILYLQDPQNIQDNVNTVYAHYMSDNFRAITKDQMYIRPKNVIVFLVSTEELSIDYRRRQSFGSYLMEYLPKDCNLLYLDCGQLLLVKYRSKPKYHVHLDPILLQQPMGTLNLAQMPSIFFPEIDGLEINAYTDITKVKTRNVKTVLLFISSKKLSPLTERDNEDIASIRKDINDLMSRCGDGVSFGGGCVKAAKSMIGNQKRVNISKQVIFTFGGNRVRSASTVITSEDIQEIQTQLLELKNGLDFNCEDRVNCMTIGFVFSDFWHYSTVEPQFEAIFSQMTYFVIISDRNFGKHFVANDQTNRSPKYSDIDPENVVSGVVIVNIRKI